MLVLIHNNQLKAKILLIELFVLMASVAFAQGSSELIDLYQEQVHLLRHQLAIAIDFCIVVSLVTLLTALYFLFEHKIDRLLFNASERIREFKNRYIK